MSNQPRETSDDLTRLAISQLKAIINQKHLKAAELAKSRNGDDRLESQSLLHEIFFEHNPALSTLESLLQDNPYTGDESEQTTKVSQ